MAGRQNAGDHGETAGSRHLSAPPHPTTARSRSAFSNRGARRSLGGSRTPRIAQDPIVRSLNALALLASGNPAYVPLVRKEARWAANFSVDSMQTWYYGYVMMLLSEYVKATGDESVMPGLRRLALEAANGQSIVGSWGHGFARSDGRLGGYGMMNAPGLPLTISLVMARDAGLKDPAVERAIERSTRLLRFYIGKGAIPYGDHHPWIQTHEDNGKCGMAAVLFNLLGEPKGAEFFSRMSVASHGSERDCGHTGNFFNILWSLPGVAQSGPQRHRRVDERVRRLVLRPRAALGRQLRSPRPAGDAWRQLPGLGSHRRIPPGVRDAAQEDLSDRKAPGITPQLDAAAARALILDGRGWSNKDRYGAYDKFGDDKLLECLASWSPVVRERAAMALARRKDAPVPALLKMLESPSLDARYGACQALATLKGAAAPAVPALRKTLRHQDLWLRIKAADALAAIGQPAMSGGARTASIAGPGQPDRTIRAACSSAIFPLPCSSVVASTVAGCSAVPLTEWTASCSIKRCAAGLKNEDGRARGTIGSVYRNLSAEEIKPLLPAILQAVVESAPSGIMFADEIRVEGLRVLAKHRVKEGIDACVNYTRTQNPWASEHRTPELMKILLTYGAHAKSAIPELARIADYFEKGEKDFPRELSLAKAKCVRETIRAIEASNEFPELIRIK